MHRVAARALIVRDKKILITKEVSEHPELEIRGVPGGGVDRGEDFRQALIRELKEELNISIRDQQVPAYPIKIDFCDMLIADTEYIIPTVQAYFIVELTDDQIPVAGENDFLWLSAEEVRSARFVTHAESALELMLAQL